MNRLTRIFFAAFVTISAAAICRADTPPVAAAPAAAAPATSTSGPKISFETPIYDFGKVKSGEPVKYTFVFTNSGTELLMVSNVQPSCGCTTAGEWSRQVEPGKTGNIAIQFNSANYSGPVTKTITVTSNDKDQPAVTLQIKGTIWKPIDMNPQFAVLNVSAESESASTSVHIVNNMDDPITLSDIESSNPAFTATLKTNQPGKDFDLMIKIVPPKDAPSAQSQISLKTSSTNVPTINVTAWANVQPIIAISPPQISLPAPPLPNKQTVSIMIQNNGTNNITLSEPAVAAAKGVEAQVAESQPGKLFTVTVTFPQGFELPQNGPVELTVKSTHPRYPVIKVPIAQLPHTTITPIAHPTIVPVVPAPPTPGAAAPAPATTSAARPPTQ